MALLTAERMREYFRNASVGQSTGGSSQLDRKGNLSIVADYRVPSFQKLPQNVAPGHLVYCESDGKFYVGAPDAKAFPLSEVHVRGGARFDVVRVIPTGPPLDGEALTRAGIQQGEVFLQNGDVYCMAELGPVKMTPIGVNTEPLPPPVLEPPYGFSSKDIQPRLDLREVPLSALTNVSYNSKLKVLDLIHEDGTFLRFTDVSADQAARFTAVLHAPGEPGVFQLTAEAPPIAESASLVTTKASLPDKEVFMGALMKSIGSGAATGIKLIAVKKLINLQREIVQWAVDTVVDSGAVQAGWLSTTRFGRFIVKRRFRRLMNNPVYRAIEPLATKGVVLLAFGIAKQAGLSIPEKVEMFVNEAADTAVMLQITELGLEVAGPTISGFIEGVKGIAALAESSVSAPVA